MALFTLTACGETDEDRVRAFSEAITGELSQERVQTAIDKYVDLNTQVLDVGAYGESRSYNAQDRATLDADARRRLPRFYGTRLQILKRHIELKGTTAYLELQLFSKEGMASLRCELHKHGERWLLGALRLNQ
jgi:hypothetical protein